MGRYPAFDGDRATAKMYPSKPKALENTFDWIQRISWQTGFLPSSAWATRVHTRDHNTRGGPRPYLSALSYVPNTLQGPQPSALSTFAGLRSLKLRDCVNSCEFLEALSPLQNKLQLQLFELCCDNLALDLNKANLIFANSAIAANTLVRSTLGGASPLFATRMYRN
ncbi:hypothetical protein N7449_008163 [Penicillium cf. viridicatum]|uniref:Uncharacterized protein n=1 Tax=Penicillium cf. viridicatum TaxID=2972119 RepID=A0A9W9JIN9_9EURO|nr:hypothetical protein N7449_008163 [Penicillium cf. viridicatum]